MTKHPNKIILHIDMDAFYAAIEVRDNPELKGKPLVIGALPGQRGVVSTCSYEARKFGIRSAMNIKEAYQRAPHAIYMKPRMEYYAQVSHELRKIWTSYTDQVEFIAFDEAYIDLTSKDMTFDTAIDIAREIKNRVRREQGLTASVGIGYNKSAAKTASEENKPDGLFVIPNRQAWLNLVVDRPVSCIYGCGRKSAERLNQMGIFTVRDLLDRKDSLLAGAGKHLSQIIQIADGRDDRELVPYHESQAKSIGTERTFQEDTKDLVFLQSLLRLYASELAHKLREDDIYARTISLKLTFQDMSQITRSITVDPTRDSQVLYKQGVDLLNKVNLRLPVRLIGLSVSNFTEEFYQQMTLGDLIPEKQEQGQRRQDLENTLTELEKKFGLGTFRTAAELEAEKNVRDKKF